MTSPVPEIGWLCDSRTGQQEVSLLLRLFALAHDDGLVGHLFSPALRTGVSADAEHSFADLFRLAVLRALDLLNPLQKSICPLVEGRLFRVL